MVCAYVAHLILVRLCPIPAHNSAGEYVVVGKVPTLRHHQAGTVTNQPRTAGAGR